MWIGFASLASAPAAAGPPPLPSVPGSEVTLYANVVDPVGLSFAPSGDLFVGRDAAGSGGGNGDAAKIHRVGAGGAPVVLGSGFAGSYDLEFGPDGAFYASDCANDRIVRVAPPIGLDAFLCYKARASKGSPRFEPTTVQLADAFGARSAQVVKPHALCNPADREGAGVDDAATHLASFGIAPTPRPAKLAGLAVSNGLGNLTLDTNKLDRLLVPAAKSLEGAVDPLVATGVDHFACYEVKVSKGTPKLPKGTQTSVADQFDEARTLDVKKPTRLCLPVDKNGEGIQRLEDALVCYKAKPAKGERKHARRKGVHVNHQFGPAELDTIKEEELCLPSTLARAE